MNGEKFSDKATPLFTVTAVQFPRAFKAIAKRSQLGHEKYKDTDLDWLNFSRVPNAFLEYSNAMFRHAMNEGEDSEEQHVIATAWNAIARAEVYLKELELKNSANQKTFTDEQ
jgi:hypothetical protein